MKADKKDKLKGQGVYLFLVFALCKRLHFMPFLQILIVMSE